MSTEARDRLRQMHSELPDPSILNLSYALGLEGPLDVDALAWAFDRIAESFPSLGAPSGQEMFDWHDLTDPEAQNEITPMIDAVSGKTKPIINAEVTFHFNNKLR